MFDPDEFIAGIRTAQSRVTIFKRPDLAGELNAIDEDIAALGEPEDEQDMTAGVERAELLGRRERVFAELAESAVEFTLQALSTEQVDEIGKTARKACKDRADDAVKTAIAATREEFKRAEVTDAKELKEGIKRAASNASSAVVQHETGIQILAAAIVTDTGQQAFTADQMRTVAEKIGAGQMQKLQRAFYELTSVDPGSILPKSLTHGATVKD